jgi:hypothetical protein
MIEYITYEGEQYPIRVSYYALTTGTKEAGAKNLDDMEAQTYILYYALVAGHRLAKKELTLNLEDMIWVLDSCFVEFQKMTQVFIKQLADATAGAEQTGKKK